MHFHLFRGAFDLESSLKPCISQLSRCLMRSDIDVAFTSPSPLHPLQHLECLRAVALAGHRAVEALKTCSRGLSEALTELSWRHLALSLLENQQEDPVGCYLGSWRATCLQQLSGAPGRVPRAPGASRALKELRMAAEPRSRQDVDRSSLGCLGTGRISWPTGAGEAQRTVKKKKTFFHHLKAS